MEKRTAVLGRAFHSRSFDEVEYFDRALFIIDGNGVIEDVFREGSPDFDVALEKARKSGGLKILSRNEVLIPGFVDTHIHAPQWAQSGTALDQPLEVWLQEYTFPLEARMKDLEFAERVYSDVVDTTLRHGTTTSLYFATVDRKPSELLCRIAGEKGQRALVGKVVMDDRLGNPDFCRDESPERAIEETEEFIRNILDIQDDYAQKVYPVITPRFIPSCTDESLRGMGDLIEKYGIHVQTHCSESDWEHGFALERYGITDAEALDRFGILTDRTVVAHATFLTEENVKLLARRGTSIGHSPISNAYFASSVLPLREFHEKGVTIGLATDVSGGYSPSMYAAIRQAVISSRMLDTGVDPRLPRSERGRAGSAITLNNAFYTATVGGGEALKLPVGRFEKGYSFDAQVVDISRLPIYMDERKDEDLLHRILLLSESSDISEVWVQGRKVR